MNEATHIGFDDLELPPEIQRAIENLEYEACTPVQAAVLPHALDGRDVIGQAQTGTGKTAAFLITILTYHLENPEEAARPSGTPFALVIAPTRELALQIAKDADDIGEFTDTRVHTLIGGVDYDRQQRQLKGALDLVVATPGRLLDFCRKRLIDLSSIEILVIDEADRMLDMGFIDDIRRIIRQTPMKNKRQTLLFSATINVDVRRLANSWTLDAMDVAIEPEKLAVDTIEQYVYLTTERDKTRLLLQLIQDQHLTKIMVFTNRRDMARKVDRDLRRAGIRCGLLTGDVPQRQRIRILDQFKTGAITALIATDVAGRGIHVDDVSHVINYDLPEDPEDYVHRIGRTGRAGAKGVSISFAGEADIFNIPAIEELLGDKMETVQPHLDRLDVPTN